MSRLAFVDLEKEDEKLTDLSFPSLPFPTFPPFSLAVVNLPPSFSFTPSASDTKADFLFVASQVQFEAR